MIMNFLRVMVFCAGVCRCTEAKSQPRPVHLLFGNIELLKAVLVLDILLPAFKTQNIDTLEFSGNRLGHEGIVFITDLLEANITLRVLQLSEDRFHDLFSVTLLLSALKEHTSIQELMLQDVDLGGNTDIISAILEAAKDKPITRILRSNHLLKSTIFGNCNCVIKACNPSLEGLDLSENEFNDEDATLLA